MSYSAERHTVNSRTVQKSMSGALGSGASEEPVEDEGPEPFTPAQGFVPPIDIVTPRLSMQLQPAELFG